MIFVSILKRFIINYYFQIIHLLFLILLIFTSFSCSTLPSLGRRWRGRRPGPCRRYDLVQDVVDGGAGGGAHGRVREVQEGRGHGAGDTAQDGGSRTEQGADKLVLSLRPFIILDSDVHQSQNWRTLLVSVLHHHLGEFLVVAQERLGGLLLALGQPLGVGDIIQHVERLYI